MKHVELPSGGRAQVSADAKPETIEALDQIVQAAATAVKFPDGCLAIYRGGLFKVIKRSPPQHGNENVYIEHPTNGGPGRVVAVKHLLTPEEYEQRLEEIHGAFK